MDLLNSALAMVFVAGYVRGRAWAGYLITYIPFLPVVALFVIFAYRAVRSPTPVP